MVLRGLFIVASILVLALPAFTQSYGGAPEAYGGAGLGTKDIWSSYYNQAGLADIKGIAAGVFYKNEFLVSELGEGGASFAMPLGTNVVGVSFRTFGYEL